MLITVTEKEKLKHWILKKKKIVKLKEKEGFKNMKNIIDKETFL